MDGIPKGHHVYLTSDCRAKMQAFMSPTTIKSERRKKLRKKPLRLVYVELASGNGGMMRDLSEEGFAVRAMMPVRVGDKTPFSFTLGDTTRIEGEGKILWIDEGGRVAGVQFTQISSEMKTQIDDWLIDDEKIASPRETHKEPAIAAASTMEELREEIRSTPVRAEAALPVVEEQPPATVEKSEVELVPAVEAKPKVESVPIEEPKPAPDAARAPTAPPASSMTEGFFRKWPKTPAASTRAVETQAADVAPRAPSSVSPPPRSHPKKREFEEEEETPRVAATPLPDISEILMQPRGMSANAGPRNAAVQPLTEVPEAAESGHNSWEWFTLSRAVLSMVVLTTLVGMYVYHREVGRGLIWLGEALGGTSGSPTSMNTGGADGASQAGETKPLQPADSGVDAGTSSGGASNTQSSLSRASKGTTVPVTPLSGITPPVSPEASPDSGQSEYLQAVQILRGRNAGTDTPEAVRLLWIAVEKANPSAEVMLADLYWHGQGVAKNCDQTRILLTAAARKGSAAAQKRLQQFQQEGCE
jgi:hypothetical protein